MTDTFSTKGLDQLIKLFGKKMPKVQVGIFENSNGRADHGGPTNAEIGRNHEYGTDILPVRSWLRMPLQDQFQKAVEKAGFTKKTVKEMIQNGAVFQLFNELAIVAEGVVLEGFNSGGYGKWKPSNMARKKNHQTLVETQQMRNAVGSRVVK